MIVIKVQYKVMLMVHLSHGIRFERVFKHVSRGIHKRAGQI